MPIENELSAVEQVYALEGLPLPADLTPEPEPAVITEPLDEVEALKADIIAFGDATLIERYQRLMTDAEAILHRKAEQDEQLKVLIKGQELYFADTMPDAALAFYNTLSVAEQEAFRETLAQQYQLAIAVPYNPVGDGATYPNPMAGPAPDFPPDNGEKQ